jgi:hypothetical protein
VTRPSPDFYCSRCDVFDIEPHEHERDTVPSEPPVPYVPSSRPPAPTELEPAPPVDGEWKTVLEIDFPGGKEVEAGGIVAVVDARDLWLEGSPEPLVPIHEPDLIVDPAADPLERFHFRAGPGGPPPPPTPARATTVRFRGGSFLEENAEGEVTGAEFVEGIHAAIPDAFSDLDGPIEAGFQELIDTPIGFLLLPAEMTKGVENLATARVAETVLEAQRIAGRPSADFWAALEAKASEAPEEPDPRETCEDCRNATGGECRAHYTPECTCYEAMPGHEPGCPMRRRDGGS